MPGRFEPHKCREYENNTDRCPIKIYQKYINLLPEKRDESSFYFQPLSKPKPHVWFSLQSVGHNKLEGVVKGIMSAAGFVGNFSNHSLWASTAARLYWAGVSDQLIKEQTGHRSNAIEAYKRTSDIQKRDVSRVISGQPTIDVQRMEDHNVKTNIEFPYNLINCDKYTVVFVGSSRHMYDRVEISIYHWICMEARGDIILLVVKFWPGLFQSTGLSSWSLWWWFLDVQWGIDSIYWRRDRARWIPRILFLLCLSHCNVIYLHSSAHQKRNL